MTKDRGFKKLKGFTIGRVDASCINHVVLFADDGKTAFMISAEMDGPLNIPVLSIVKHVNKPKAVKLNPPKPTKVKEPKPAWPFPTIEDQSLD
jgi:hypothetical protein